MPIHDQSYRHWQGALDPRAPKWLVIARAGVRMLWRRWMILLVTMATIPFLVRLAQIYIATRLRDELQFVEFAKQFQVNAGLFWGFLDKQFFFVLLTVIFAGAGLISKDRKHNALQIYFSKPLTQTDYLLGKVAILSFFIGIVTFVPAVLLFAARLVMSENMDFFGQYYWIPGSMLAYYVLLVLVLGGLVLALSSLGRGARFAAIGFFAVIGFTDLLRAILSFAPNAGVVSIGANIKQVGAFLFDQSTPSEFPTWLALLVLVGVVALCFFTLKRKVRGTEVVT